jgi:transcriptional regulator with XRE-family HTH domain
VPKSVYTVAYGRMLARLVEARRSAGLNQVELAEKLGRPQSFVSKIEKGDRRIDVLELIAICHHLRIDPADVITAVNDGTLDLNI